MIMYMKLISWSKLLQTIKYEEDEIEYSYERFVTTMSNDSRIAILE